MTYLEFRDKYNGRYLDYDGGYPPGNPYQCWDLGQYYFTEVLGVPDSVLSGCGLVSNMLYPPKRAELDEYFYEVDAYHMCQGDVAIWEAGHIAVLDSFDGNNWWFSQNPGPCMIKTIDNLGAYHVFRRKQPTPPTPTEVTPNVERNPYQDQLEVITDGLRVRATPSVDGAIVGLASKGEGDKKYYNYYEKYTNTKDQYDWYRIADNQWLAHRNDWVVLYPKQEPTEPPTIPPTEPPKDYVKLEVLDRKDGNVLVNVPMWIKE